MRNKSLKLALAASAVLTLAACSASPGGGAGGGAGAVAPSYEVTANTPAPTGELDKLTWSTYAEPFSLDYVYAFDYADNQILSNVCESLVRLNDDMSISPGLATKYENRTPNTWVYTIREGVKFHDGTTLTADDVVASMNRHLDPKVGSFWFSVYQNVESIKKTGPNEVTVTSKVPGCTLQRVDVRCRRRYRQCRNHGEARRRLRQLQGRGQLHRTVRAQKVAERREAVPDAIRRLLG